MAKKTSCVRSIILLMLVDVRWGGVGILDVCNNSEEKRVEKLDEILAFGHLCWPLINAEGSQLEMIVCN